MNTHMLCPHCVQPSERDGRGTLPGSPAARGVFCACRLLAEWVPALNSMDELWVPTEHARAALRASGITVPMHIVPIAVNSSRLDPAKHRPAQLPVGHAVRAMLTWPAAGAS